MHEPTFPFHITTLERVQPFALYLIPTLVIPFPLQLFNLILNALDERTLLGRVLPLYLNGGFLPALNA